MARLQFTKQQRLLTRFEFQHVYQGEVFAADDVLVVKAITNDVGQLRLGLSVSRKFGNAVVRNRWKRIVRETFRLNQHQFPQGIDIVVRPRKGSVCESSAVQRSLPKLIARVAKKLVLRSS